MSTFDTAVIFVLSMSVIYSLFRGMIKEIFSLLGMVVGYIAAMKYNGALAEHLEKVIAVETVAKATAFALIFVTGTFVVGLIGYFVRKLLHSSGALSGVDRIVGGAFGLIKGALLIALVTAPLQMFDDTYADLTKDSVTAPHLENFTANVQKLLDVEDGIMDKIPDSIKDIGESLPDAEEIKDFAGDIGEHVKILDELKKPQDQHSEADKEKLDQLIQSIDKK